MCSCAVWGLCVNAFCVAPDNDQTTRRQHVCRTSACKKTRWRFADTHWDRGQTRHHTTAPLTTRHTTQHSHRQTHNTQLSLSFSFSPPLRDHFVVVSGGLWWCCGGAVVVWWCCGGAVVVLWCCGGAVVVLWWCCGVVVVCVVWCVLCGVVCCVCVWCVVCVVFCFSLSEPKVD